MASISGTTSSLGNTSLRGIGGMGSGIDRDSIIEQMTAGTQSKITNQKNKITSLGWKQEAYQAVSGKMLDLQDKYFSFSAGSNLKYSSMFAKNQITTMGDSDITKFVSATGSSNMLDYLSILGVKQLATSSTLVSAAKGNGSSSIGTNIKEIDDIVSISKLEGRQLRFGTYSGEQYQSAGIFTFPPSYTYTEQPSGEKKTEDIDYTIDLEADSDLEVDGVKVKGGVKLAMQLNKALESSGIKSGTESISDVMKFEYAGGKMQLVTKENKTTSLVINSSSTALTALGYNSKKLDGSEKDVSQGITLEALGDNQNQFKSTYVSESKMLDYLTGKKLTISFGGQTKEIELVKEEDKADIHDLEDLKQTIQTRLNRAFGEDNIKLEVENGSLSFKLGDNVSSSMTLTITSDSAEMRKVLGIKKGASNKLNLEGSIADNIDKLLPDGASEQEKTDFLQKLAANKGLVINGVTIKDITADTSLNSMIEKINANKDVGVKASYLSSSNQFVLVASDTGSGRKFELDDVSKQIFGADAASLDENDTIISNINKLASGTASSDDYTKLNINGVQIDGLTATSTIDEMVTKINEKAGDTGVKVSYNSTTEEFVWTTKDGGKTAEPALSGGAAKIFSTLNEYKKTHGSFQMGQNAQILVSYGNGVNTMIESSSNTFNLEGLKVTVSQEFGKLKETNGMWTSEDKSQSVTFSAKADVDGVTEIVKKFVEDYNEMIKEINTQVTTKPNKSYGPLTEEQKDEMSEKSIENWENKAKQGLLYNDSTMRALSMDMQGVLTSLMSSGVSYKDLEEIGLTISDDYLDGGTITFNEAKFKAAMTSDPEEVSNIFTGGGDVKKGLASIIEDTMTPYATKYANRNGNSYGRLIEEAGSEKVPLSVMNNQIYRQLKEMQEVVETLQSRLQNEQDRYIKQFTTMETLISQMNSQASYLSQFQA